MISVDTETTGVDLRHGAKPFLVTICNEQNENFYWEWDVEPTNRQPYVSKRDLKEIQEVIDDEEELVFQNPRFDVKALENIGIKWTRDHWDKTFDTLIAGHILASNQPHDLTTMSMVYLGVNVQPFEDAIQDVTNAARRLARKKYKEWRIATPGMPELPSVKTENKKKSARGIESESPWKNDMWLPRAIAIEENYPEDHVWFNSCAEYANSDTSVTLPLFFKMKEKLLERELWEIYLERLKILKPVYKVESNGVTLNKRRKKELTKDYTDVADECRRICLEVSDNKIEELPVNGVSNALRDVVFNHFGLVSPKKTKGGNPSMDKEVLEDWILELDPETDAYKFIDNLRKYRQRKTALGYIKSYDKFWFREKQINWFRLHPSLNPTGSNTLRFSCYNPNAQQISKKEGFNLRYCFGPAPGREWWSLDANNIELRLPGYESGEQAMIDIFEKPDEAPYYGSYHMLIFSILHPEKFAQDGFDCKNKYASTYYSWTKNFNFADQYGAGEETTSKAAHLKGAQELVAAKLTEKVKLNKYWIDFANENGFVETIPDKTVNSKQGYPLLCTRNHWGKIKSTIPLNYHVQGSAMWWMMKAMIRCHDYLEDINSRCIEEYKMVMQVHDELVFDFPKGMTPKTNLPKIRKIKRLMEEGGNDFGIPTPCSVEYHPTTWSESEKF